MTEQPIIPFQVVNYLRNLAHTAEKESNVTNQNHTDTVQIEAPTKKKWTQQEDDFLAENFAIMKVADISTQLGFSRQIIYSKIRDLGLREQQKPEEKVEDIHVANIYNRESGAYSICVSSGTEFPATIKILATMVSEAQNNGWTPQGSMTHVALTINIIEGVYVHVFCQALVKEKVEAANGV